MSTNADQPKLEYWMLNIIHDALQREYDRYKKQSGINSQLAMSAKRKGLGFAKELEKEIQQNRFHPLGQIYQSMKWAALKREQITSECTTNPSQ